jgi:hypothetical protein
MSSNAKSHSASRLRQFAFAAGARRKLQRRCRARRGVGEQRPMKTEDIEPAVVAFSSWRIQHLGNLSLCKANFSQFVVPRRARIARHTEVVLATSPRSSVDFQDPLSSSALRGHQHRNAWPNPSVELTHSGTAPWPFGGFVYSLPHGQGAAPARSAHLQR